MNFNDVMLERNGDFANSAFSHELKSTFARLTPRAST